MLNPSNLDERLREGMAMSTPKFVSFDTGKDIQHKNKEHEG
jgi:hypothetical protein